MKNKNEIRTMLMINFMAELIGIITLYLNSTQVIKILKINVISYLFILFSIVGIFLIYKLVNTKQEKVILICSFLIELLVILFSFFTKSKNIVPYFQVLSDVLKYILIINIYKSISKSRKKKDKEETKKIILITILAYLVAKICYMLINLLNGLTIIPVLTTISIIGIVIVYTLYIKSLEKDS